MKFNVPRPRTFGMQMTTILSVLILEIKIGAGVFKQGFHLKSIIGWEGRAKLSVQSNCKPTAENRSAKEN